MKIQVSPITWKACVAQDVEKCKKVQFRKAFKTVCLKDQKPLQILPPL